MQTCGGHRLATLTSCDGPDDLFIATQCAHSSMKAGTIFIVFGKYFKSK